MIFSASSGVVAVLVIPTGIAYVRRRRDHHLAVVAGISQGLLITRHAGREDCLAKCLTDCTKRPSVERAAVLKHQERRRRSFNHRNFRAR